MNGSVVLQVTYVTSFNSTSFPGALALAKEDTMMIGNMDEIQKLQLRTIPLGEQPRRIAHQEASRSFAVICEASPYATAGQTQKKAGNITFALLPWNSESGHKSSDDNIVPPSYQLLFRPHIGTHFVGPYAAIQMDCIVAEVKLRAHCTKTTCVPKFF